MKTFLFLSLLPLISFAMEHSCPEGTRQVTRKYDYSSAFKKWCVLELDGAELKHGPELRVLPSGKKFVYQYEKGRLVDKPVPRKSRLFDRYGRAVPQIFQKNYFRNFPWLAGRKPPLGIPYWKTEQQLYLETREHAEELLPEIFNGGQRVEDNVYHDAFLQVPGMNRKKMNKLARHYLKQIRDKKYIHAVMIRSGILYPAYKELNDHIESGNFAMARTMLSDFGLSPVQEYVERDLALAPVITAAISEKGEQVLKMILEKLGEGANPVLACSLEMQKCGKRRIPSRCTPMAAALAADQMKNATLIMNRGGKAYWSPKQCPGELKGLVTSERPSAEFSLTKK